MFIDVNNSALLFSIHASTGFNFNLSVHGTTASEFFFSVPNENIVPVMKKYSFIRETSTNAFNNLN